ncbi:MAG TPA: signal peptidase II [Thermoanaerobaculia bacterium]
MTVSIRRAALYLAIVVATVALDLWTKQLAIALIQRPSEHFGGILTLLLTENTGAFLGLGANLSPQLRTLLFTVAVGAVLIGVAFALFTNRFERNADSIAASFILGGGLANLYERIVNEGGVTDFLYLELGPLHTGVFNIADVAITFGVIWLFISALIPEKKRPVEAAPDAD